MAKAKGFDAPNILVERVEAVSVKTLNMFHKNPRVGNVDKIAESLKTNGQFKPIVVNVGTQTSRPNEILAGNHTWLGTKRNGDELILAAFVDVDEDAATRINIADNKTADEGTYDDSILADLLASLPDAAGTGYSQDEMDDLLAGLDIPDTAEVLDDFTGALNEQEAAEAALRRKESFDGSDLGDEPDVLPPRKRSGDDDDDDQEYPDAPGKKRKGELEDASEDIKGGYALKDDLTFDTKDLLGDWGIPRLRKDMLMTFEDLPENLEAWAGSATKDWPVEDQWWLYNWGIDSTSGMKDVSKVVLSFYAWDEYFENWWYYPARYMAKVLNSGIKFLVTPNFSVYKDENYPRVMNLYSLYRARWIGRYAQEAGIKVCPDLNWPQGDRDFLDNQMLATLPVGIPLVALQMQNLDHDNPQALADEKADIQHIFDTLKPKGLLLYTSKAGLDWFEKNIKLDPSIKVKVVENRMAKLSEQAKNRTKKRTI